MKLRAPAKVNFHLTIREKRADGFHEIETLMVPISLADEISVDLRDGDDVELTCSNPDVPLGEENLAVKAARVFARHTGKPAGARIHIEKNVPMGAGLGGGSSDAASVLLALDALHGTALGTPDAREARGGAGIGHSVFHSRRSGDLPGTGRDHRALRGFRTSGRCFC